MLFTFLLVPKPTWTLSRSRILFGSELGGFSNLPSSITPDGTRIVILSNRDLTPGNPGNPDGNRELFLWTEGEGFVQLTNTEGGFNTGGKINSDGTRIAFVSSHDLAPGTPGNPDGNGEVFLWVKDKGFIQITDTMKCDNEAVSINSDGTKIAFISNCDLTPNDPGNPDGNREVFLWTEELGFRQITDTNGGEPFANFGPSLNSDGKKIAFVSNRDLTPGNPGNPNGIHEVFLWTEDAGFTQITHSISGGRFANAQPSINSTGTRIAFRSNRDLTPPRNADGNDEIFLWTEGVGITQITDTVNPGRGCNPLDNRDPSINSNGTRIAFASFHDLAPNHPGNPGLSSQIFLRTEGSPFTQITNSRSGRCDLLSNRMPAINSDGTRIAFISNRDLTPGNPGNPDGNDEIFLAKVSSPSRSPSGTFTVARTTGVHWAK